MKIVRIPRKEPSVKFSEIEPGELFEHCGEIYMKIGICGKSEAALLSTGNVVRPSYDEAVKPVSYKPLEIE